MRVQDNRSKHAHSARTHSQSFSNSPNKNSHLIISAAAQAYTHKHHVRTPSHSKCNQLRPKPPSSVSNNKIERRMKCSSRGRAIAAYGIRIRAYECERIPLAAVHKYTQSQSQYQSSSFVNSQHYDNNVEMRVFSFASRIYS